MGASSVTGTGIGSSNKATVKDLAILANGPTIHFAGIVASEDIATSPPSTGNTVTFPYVLEGNADNYVIMLTTQNGGYAYVSNLHEDEDDNFSGFSFVTEVECDLMYAVINCGLRPAVI
jgi:hypothetical protein